MSSYISHAISSERGPCNSIIEVDGLVEGGTVEALVEKLITQEDTMFYSAFLLTYKSFMTTNELFKLLVRRFNSQLPLTRDVQCMQLRIISIMRSMATDEATLEEDSSIVSDINQFLSSREPMSKCIVSEKNIESTSLLNSLKSFYGVNLGSNASSYQRLCIFDIDDMELAKQLTLLESALFHKIQAPELPPLSSDREATGNIKTIIDTSNRIAAWVSESILTEADPFKRFQTVERFIRTANNCCNLNNLSSTTAIMSGLNVPSVRRLHQTWAQVGEQSMALFHTCEVVISSMYGTTFAQSHKPVTDPAAGPGVPFIGVFLLQLRYIQKANSDNLPGGLVNFHKRQMTYNLINNMLRWQSQPFDIQPNESILAFITHAVTGAADFDASGDRFWALSLEREASE